MLFYCFLRIRRRPSSTLFPYTTLFRSGSGARWKRRCCNIPTAAFPSSRVAANPRPHRRRARSEEHTSELQSLRHLVCRLLLEKKKNHPYVSEIVPRVSLRFAVPPLDGC